jgi:hypothetical protein
VGKVAEVTSPIVDHPFFAFTFTEPLDSTFNLKVIWLVNVSAKLSLDVTVKGESPK